MESAFCLDLDGTLTQDEILPRIAREAGLYDEISVLTEATLKGILTFEKSFRLRCRLLSEVPVSRVREIVANVPLDADIAAFVAANRKRCFIATGNLDVWIEPLALRLGCTLHSSVGTVSGDRLVGVAHVLDKGDVVRSLHTTFDRVVAAGDGMNDAPMFEEADVAIAFSGVHDAVPALVDLSDYVVTDGRALCRLLATL